MLRDSKFPRRRHEEPENVDPSDSSAAAQRFVESSRPPLNMIQEPDVSIGSRIDRTPTKTTTKRPEIRTPDKHAAGGGGGGGQWKQRFGWSKNEAVSLNDDRRGSGCVGYAATPRVNKSNSTQSTPTKSASKPPPSSSARSKAEGSAVGARLGNNYAALYKGFPSSACAPPAVVNTVEVPHFDLKEDSSFWINHNVQVSE